MSDGNWKMFHFFVVRGFFVVSIAIVRAWLLSRALGTGMSLLISKGNFIFLSSSTLFRRIKKPYLSILNQREELSSTSPPQSQMF